MATIQKRISSTGAVTYMVRIRLRGQPATSATFKRVTDAKIWAAQTEAAIRENRYFTSSESKKHTLNDLITRVIESVLPEKSKSTRINQTQQLQWFSKEIGYKRLADITTPLLVQCRDKLKATGVSNATINRYFSALSHGFTVAIDEWEWLEINPCSKLKLLKEPQGVVRYLTDDERERLLAACKESLQPALYIIVVLAIASGMRKAELMNLRWPDVFLNDGFLILHKTKNKKRRRIPLSGVALELLKQHAKVRRLDTDLLFPGKVKDKPVIIEKAFSNALKRAGVENFRFHDLRHTCASYLGMSGASLAEIATILGHSSFDMVKRYAHLSDDHMSTVAAKMNEKYLTR